MVMKFESFKRTIWYDLLKIAGMSDEEIEKEIEKWGNKDGKARKED